MFSAKFLTQLLLTIASQVFAIDLAGGAPFFSFCASFDKSYSTYEDFSKGFLNFFATDAIIKKINSGHNQFSDMSPE
jgi:hypothetical protein